jgi:catechol 2,3-dioxygenase-like lactoylglutathione lyase family enzyme
MKFRHARHTNDLEKLEKFYTEIVGLEKLGEFNNHSEYNGLFLGFPGMDWHIEFTASNDDAVHTPDADDLLVFYPNNTDEYDAILSRIEEKQVPIQQSKNPYWVQNGVEILDPDGFGVVIAKP